MSYSDFEFKMIIAVRSDLKLTKAKTAVHVSHVAVLGVEDAKRKKSLYLKRWFSEGQKKVTVKIPSEELLEELYQKAKRENLPCAIIKSKDPNTINVDNYIAVAIGPAPNDKISNFTRNLKLM